MLKQKGPLLLACNHPNSFLDALILGSFFRRPVHFLARGDAFKNAVVKKILDRLNVIPIYRLSEGKEHLALNDHTFGKCAQVLKEGGIVLIFSEGLCLNQWKLRALKKGTARIAISAWQHPGICDYLKVVPVAFNYSTFTRFRKNVVIVFGEPLSANQVDQGKSEGEQMVCFNSIVYKQLYGNLLHESENNAYLIEFLINNTRITKSQERTILVLKKVQSVLVSTSLVKKIGAFRGTKRLCFKNADLVSDVLFCLLFFIPAFVCLLIHLPVYIPLERYIRNKTKGSVFYHSAFFGALIVAYPFYVFILSILIAVVFKNLLILLLIILLPAGALLYQQWQDKYEGVVNYFQLSAGERLAIRRAWQA
jgi:1-acyl-sn-glycerol-3-phosphate acyltransferase